MGVTAGKWIGADTPTKTAQAGDESIFERRLVHSDLFGLYAGFAKNVIYRSFRLVGRLSEQVQPISKPLHIGNGLALANLLGDQSLCLPEISCSEFQPLCSQAAPQLRGCPDLTNFALMYQRHPITSLCLVEVRSCDQDCEPVGGQMR